MLRCIAVDDEDLALELLEDNIGKVPFLQLVGSTGNPLHAVKIIQELQPDLVFLDIQMPGLTGLQLIQSSASSKCMFILITAYEKYALDSYDLNVVDYLLKPVELPRFIKACNKALELHQLRNRQQASGSPDPGFFFVNVDYSLVKIQKHDILWIEGLKDYVKIHLRAVNAPIVTRMSIKSIEEELSQQSFIRIHKSYVVAVDAITAVRKNSLFIGRLELPVSENYRDALQKLTGRA